MTRQPWDAAADELEAAVIAAEIAVWERARWSAEIDATRERRIAAWLAYQDAIQRQVKENFESAELQDLDKEEL